MPKARFMGGEPYACVIFNLHVDHHAAAIENARGVSSG